MPEESSLDCPLCSRACHSRNHLRDHLEEDHRKMAVIDAYLEAHGI